jgi:hypothetical protein
MEAKQVQVIVIATAYIPNSRPSEDQKEHEDNKNEVHIFLQNIWREFASCTCGCRIPILAPSESTYLPF